MNVNNRNEDVEIVASNFFLIDETYFLKKSHIKISKAFQGISNKSIETY